MNPPQDRRDILNEPTTRQSRDILNEPTTRQRRDILNEPATRQRRDILNETTTRQRRDILNETTTRQFLLIHDGKGKSIHSSHCHKALKEYMKCGQWTRHCGLSGEF